MGYLYDAMKQAVSSDKTQPNTAPAAPKAAPPPPASKPSTERDDAPRLRLHDAAEPEPAKKATIGARHVCTEVSDIDDRLVALTKTSSLMSEEYRAIRTSLLARWEHRRHLVHTLTSATPQEGKTITSLNLGLSFAELRNRHTLVVEADLRLPQFGKLFNLPAGPGLVQVIEGGANLADAVVEIGDTRLCPKTLFYQQPKVALDKRQADHAREVLGSFLEA